MCPIAHPCPQLRSRTNSGFTRVSPPVVVPFPRVDRQVEFWNGVLAQDLAECQRKDAVVLCWEKAPTRHEHEHTPPRSARRKVPSSEVWKVVRTCIIRSQTTRGSWYGSAEEGGK